MKPPLSRIPADVVAVTDYEPLARERVSPQAWAYIASGAADERTLHHNRDVFDALTLAPRVLADLTDASTTVELFGQTFAHPMLLAPIAYQKLAHPDGELATAHAASALRTGMVVSAQASVKIEDVARATQAPLWCQLYVQPDRACTRELAQRAEAAGYTALVLTVDAPVSGVRNREQRAGFRLPDGVSAVNLADCVSPDIVPAALGDSPVFGTGMLRTAPTWHDVAWLREQSSLPILIKGILTPDDARVAVEAGASGIVVSNHGGRTLDTLPASLDALPRVVAAVAGRVPVLVDGGIRRGTDVLKAIALGASAVLIGRPYIWGLAAAGITGVAHVINMLWAELEIAMALTGCATIADVDHRVIWPSGHRDV
jgi:4-hydroxymandelate oxidase